MTQKHLTDLEKFTALTYIKDNADLMKTLSVSGITSKMKEVLGIVVHDNTIYNWARTYGFEFKRNRSSKNAHAEFLQDTENKFHKVDKRVKIVAIVLANLCKELGVKCPSMLSAMLEGLTEELNGKGETNHG